MIPFDFSALAQASTGRLLNTVAEGIGLAGVSWLILRIAGRRSAVTRFAVWFSTLLAVGFMPLLVRSAASGVLHEPGLELPGAWATDLFVAWAAIAALLLARLAGSLWHVRRLRSECREMDLEKHVELAEIFRQQTTQRKIRLLTSDKVRVPTAIGFFRPAVILPTWAMEQLAAEELKVILLHELAHLRRWDDWTNLAQKLLKAIFFFHPAVWFIESRLALEREMACDDMVLQQMANARSYAASLVSLAEKALSQRLPRTIALAQSAVGRVRQTSLRIAQILDPERVHTIHGWRFGIAATASVAILALVATPYAPEMIAFRGNGPAVSAQSTRSNAITPIRVPAIRASARISSRRVAPAVIPAHVKTGNSAKPKVVLAKAVAPQATAPILLLFETTTFDPSGEAVWTLSVWRVSAGADGQRWIEETVVMKI